MLSLKDPDKNGRRELSIIMSSGKKTSNPASAKSINTDESDSQKTHRPIQNPYHIREADGVTDLNFCVGTCDSWH